MTPIPAIIVLVKSHLTTLSFFASDCGICTNNECITCTNSGELCIINMSNGLGVFKRIWKIECVKTRVHQHKHVWNISYLRNQTVKHGINDLCQSFIICQTRNLVAFCVATDSTSQWNLFTWVACHLGEKFLRCFYDTCSQYKLGAISCFAFKVVSILNPGPPVSSAWIVHWRLRVRFICFGPAWSAGKVFYITSFCGVEGTCFV